MMNTSSFHLERRCEVVFGVVGVIPEDFPHVRTLTHVWDSDKQRG